mmetsp:Transcript_47113/g.143161  ORF Transcript_47113/g.143161 Transcript_47113/m.143161 type:complete len:410 (-) Transcript_47113:7-1236(-)
MGLLVLQDKRLLHVVARGTPLDTSVDLASELILPVQALHQLLSPLFDTIIDVLLAQIAVSRLLRVLVLADGTLAPSAALDPLVRHHCVGRGPGLLHLIQHLPDELLAERMDTFRDLHLLIPDIVLVLEGEAATDEPIHDDAHGPHVYLGPVVLVVELWRPEDFRAHPSCQPLVDQEGAGCAEVREHDLAFGIDHVLPVHQVVVTFDVPVDDALSMQVLDAGAHLIRDVHDVVAVDLTPLLQVTLKAFDQIATAVLVHHNADETPFEENPMHLDDVRVVQGLEQLCLPLDGFDRRLNLVDHLHRVLLASGPLPASRHHAEGALTERLADGVLLQEPHGFLLLAAGTNRARLLFLAVLGDARCRRLVLVLRRTRTTHLHSTSGRVGTMVEASLTWASTTSGRGARRERTTA